MSLFLLPVGIVLPTLIGWCMLRLLEGHESVLGRGERWVFGFLLGLTATMYITFLAYLLIGVQFSFAGFLGTQVLTLAAVAVPIAVLKLHKVPAHPVPTASEPIPRWMKILLIILLGWITLKILVSTSMLVTVPAFLDDTLSNWNIRGKLFFETQRLELILPAQLPGETVPSGISSYPPAIPLVKAWLSSIAGKWDEGLANSIHLLWFLAAIGIVFILTRRASSAFWGGVAVYLLASLPLYIVQGTNPYGDVFLSGHIASAVGFLFLAVRSTERRETLAFLRLSAFATALLPFTKNEGLVLYLPIVFVVLAGSLIHMLRTHRLTLRDVMIALFWYGLLLLLVAGPWIGFKWMHGLPFGNAKGIGGLFTGWQPGVVQAIIVNTFFEGNWLLLFPLLILLFVFAWRSAFKTPLAVFSAAFLLLYIGQMPIFLFTGLATEALYQTGYARGLIHLMPIVITLATLLLRDIWRKWTAISA
jgi:hypothetical protein